GRVAGVGPLPGLPGPPAGGQQIEAVFVGGQPGAGPALEQPAPLGPRRQCRLPQPSPGADVAVDGRDRARGGGGGPGQVGQLGPADELAGPDEQHREDQALLAGAEIEFGVGPPGPDRAEHGEPNRPELHWTMVSATFSVSGPYGSPTPR